MYLLVLIGKCIMSVTSARGCFYKHSFFYQRCDVAQCRIGRTVAYLGPFATGQRSFKAVIQAVNYLPLTLVEFGVGMAVPIRLFYHYNSCGKYTNYSPQKKNMKVSIICLSVLLPFCNPSVPLLPRYMVMPWFR